jgi:hypothetical protein
VTLAAQRKGRIRPIFAGIFGILSVFAILVALLLGYLTRSLFNPDAFADRAASSLKHEGVARLIATRITDQLIAYRPDLIAFRPILIGTTHSIVSSAPFSAMIRRAARVSHRTLLSETGKNISLTVADAGVILRSSFMTNPQLANKIPTKLNTLLASINETPGGSSFAKFLHLIRTLRIGAFTLLLLGIVFGVISVSLSSERRFALFRFGIAIAITAIVLRLLIRFGGKVLASFATDPLVAQAVDGLWQSFLGNFMTWALILAIMGVVLSAGASSLLERMKLADILNKLRNWFREYKISKTKHALTICLLFIAGTLLLFYPAVLMTFLALIAGMSILFVAVREFFSLALSSLPKIQQHREEDEQNFSLARTSIIAAFLLILIGAGIYFLFRHDSAANSVAAIETCNGFKELCNRRLNEVVFPAAHNAMSGADITNWMFPNHEKSIQTQLQDGIRAFLIDTHYGEPVQDKVKTMLQDEQTARKKYEEVLGVEGVEAAMRIRDRLIGTNEKQIAIYLCHGFCELGATQLLPVLTTIREFLIANPNEIIVIINQDEGVKPESIESAFKDSGLIDFVYQGPVARPWPTLEQLIKTDQRVLVFAENNSEGVKWYHPVFESVQETPYSFHDPSEFSCNPNRGGTSGSLFLLNHWIDSTPAPKPSNAQIVNSYDFLLKRARECQKQRHLLPNFIAVDFYRTGDLLKVVEALNGIKPKNI